MNERDFIYWLRGFFEIGEKGGLPVDCLTPDQVREIRRHLEMVFTPAEKSTPCTCGPNEGCDRCASFGPPTDLGKLMSDEEFQEWSSQFSAGYHY